MVETSVGGRFSEALRSATQDIHREAERAPSIREFLAGRLPRERYTRLVAQQYFIYTALEETARRLIDDPIVGRLARPELERVSSLQEDLAYLIGPRWQDVIAPGEATLRYSDRIREVGETWPGGFVAHHYVRYMGDLSGGQVLGRIARRAYDFTEDHGARFYVFEGIDDPDAYKADYRAILDEAPWDAAEQERIIAEARRVYQHNIEVFGAI